MERKKVVIFGCGTGTSYVLKGLKYFPIDITAVISVSDDGSSTGRLREEFSTPAVGDIRKVLSNLSTLPDEVRDVMEAILLDAPNQRIEVSSIYYDIKNKSKRVLWN